MRDKDKEAALKPIIAKHNLFIDQNGSRTFTIAVYRPEKDPVPGGDYRCGVKMTGTKLRYIHGIDSFQSLNLAFVYIRGQALALVKRKTKLYFDKELQCEYDIASLLLNDQSKYIKPGKLNPPNKPMHWSRRRTSVQLGDRRLRRPGDR